ncbi:MAG: NTP transferase domain-containing protein [Candidatus Staskawiczbacteria bacterium]|nr:NTP transferase domain-containing protein [Candidatus Staskawiczbacteria bacterium]MBI3337232.1 NTP transferase domain-containing protein [Candidatus Staskawiczbacteria bacterium]
MQVVILAGGLGTRLRPLTHKVPKPMVLINGKPFLEYQLEMFKKNGFEDFILCTGYLGEKIEKYFGNGKKIGIHVKYSKENEPLGTGGALKNAEKLLENKFFVIYGDSFLHMDYKLVVADFNESKKLAMTVVFKNSPKIVLNNIEVSETGEVLNYDKKNEGQSNCVEAGVHIFQKDVLNFVPENSVFSLEEELLPILIKKKELYAHITDKKFYDIGTFDRLKIFSQVLSS